MSATMKLAEWLEHRAGLKGKKLEGAVKMCEDNWLETVEDLRILANLEANEGRFKETFPQTMLRTALLMALNENPRVQADEEEASVQIEAQANEDGRNTTRQRMNILK